MVFDLFFYCVTVKGLIDNDEKVVSSKKHTQFTSRVQDSYPIYDKNGQNQDPMYDQNGCKPYPFGASHSYIIYGP